MKNLFVRLSALSVLMLIATVFTFAQKSNLPLPLPLPLLPTVSGGGSSPTHGKAVDLSTVAKRLSTTEAERLLLQANSRSTKGGGGGGGSVIGFSTIKSPGVARVIPEPQVASRATGKTVELFITQDILPGSMMAMNITFENGAVWPGSGWYFSQGLMGCVGCTFTVWDGPFSSFWPFGIAHINVVFYTPDKGITVSTGRLPVFTSDPNPGMPNITSVEFRADGYIYILGLFQVGVPVQAVLGGQLAATVFGFNDAVVLNGREFFFGQGDILPLTVDLGGQTTTAIVTYRPPNPTTPMPLPGGTAKPRSFSSEDPVEQ